MIRVRFQMYLEQWASFINKAFLNVHITLKEYTKYILLLINYIHILDQKINTNHLANNVLHYS